MAVLSYSQGINQQCVSGFFDILIVCLDIALYKIMAPTSKLYHLTLRTANTHLKIFRNFNFLDQNKVIFAMDIISLHTFIPNDNIKRCNSQKMIFFDQRTVKEASSKALLRLAELVLTPNCFSFDGNDYKLTNGVAMGTEMGPSYANVFVGFIEH